MSLRETIAAECSACRHVAVAYMAPNESAFCLQLVIGRRRSPGEKSFIRVEPIFTLNLQATLEVQCVIAKIKHKHPEVDGHASPCVFRPGGGWITVYGGGPS